MDFSLSVSSSVCRTYSTSESQPGPSRPFIRAEEATVNDAALEVPEIARDDRLKNRTVLVTGGGSDGAMAGTGAAMAVLFAVKGANVVILDRDKDRAQHTQQAVEARNGRSTVVVADVTDAVQCRQAAQVTLDAYGSIQGMFWTAPNSPWGCALN